MPPFLAELAPGAADGASGPEGLALGDTIFVKRSGIEDTGSRSRSILFHEMVHSAQCKILGSLDRFAGEYLRGLLEAGSYEGIPLKVEAYALQRRFELESSAFDVEAVIRQRLT